MVNLKTILAAALCAFSLGSAEIAAIVDSPVQAYFWLMKEARAKGCPAEMASACAAKKVNDAFACAILWQKFAMKKVYVSMYEKYIRPMTQMSDCGEMSSWSGYGNMGSMNGGWQSMMKCNWMNFDNNMAQNNPWGNQSMQGGMRNHSEIKKFYWTQIRPIKKKICRLYKKWKMFNSFMLKYKQKMLMKQYFNSRRQCPAMQCW